MYYNVVAHTDALAVPWSLVFPYQYIVLEVPKLAQIMPKLPRSTLYTFIFKS